MAPNNNYLKLFSLQAGSCIATTVGATLMIIVFIYNVSGRGYERSMNMNLQHCLLIIYIVIMMCGFVVALIGCYKIRPDKLQNGITIIISGFVLWLLLSIASFLPIQGVYRFVCIDNRCPETHWMYNTRWRDYGDTCAPEETTNSSQLDPVYAGKLLSANDYNNNYETKSRPEFQNTEETGKQLPLDWKKTTASWLMSQPTVQPMAFTRSPNARRTFNWFDTQQDIVTPPKRKRTTKPPTGSTPAHKETSLSNVPKLTTTLNTEAGTYSLKLETVEPSVVISKVTPTAACTFAKISRPHEQYDSLPSFSSAGYTIGYTFENPSGENTLLPTTVTGTHLQLENEPLAETTRPFVEKQGPGKVNRRNTKWAEGRKKTTAQWLMTQPAVLAFTRSPNARRKINWFGTHQDIVALPKRKLTTKPPTDSTPAYKETSLSNVPKLTTTRITTIAPSTFPVTPVSVEVTSELIATTVISSGLSSAGIPSCETHGVATTSEKSGTKEIDKHEAGTTSSPESVNLARVQPPMESTTVTSIGYQRRYRGRRATYTKCKVYDPVVYMALSGVLFACQCGFMIYGIYKLLDFKKALLLGNS